MTATRPPCLPWLPCLALTALTSLALLGCEDEPEPDASGWTGESAEVRELVLLRPPAETPGGSLLTPEEPTLRRVLEQLRLVAETDEAKGLFLRLGPLGGAWGQVGDLAEGLQRVRDAGKPIHCHFERADNASYALLASRCDRISMTPAGTLNLVGVGAQVFYARSLLEEVGAHADILHMGRFKGAGDVLTRDDMPPEARESLGALLDDLDAGLVAALQARELDARAAIDGGPYGSIAAREAGLVDEVAFDDEAREHARQAGDAPRVRRIPLKPPAEPLGFADVLGALVGEGEDPAPATERIALVHLHGPIVDGERPAPGRAVSGPFVDAVRDLADDDQVKAIVLRIDSPGGSALASDRMWHAVRRAAGRKPVIASVGNVAASGGYYVASAADVILAHDASVVGSIGVVGGKVSFGALAEDLGVRSVALRRGRRAGWGDPLRPFDEEEREAVEGLLRGTYYRFIRRVAQGREMERSAVLAAAEGRVMSGRAGRALGLVDEAAGLETALRRAREEAGLDADAPVQVWPPRRGFLAALTGGEGEVRAPADAWRELMAPLGAVGEAAAWMPALLEDGQAAVALPYVLVLD